MIAIALSFLVLTAAHAAPRGEEKIAYAAEVFGLITPSQMSCLRNEKYKVALVEAYSDGEFKKDAIPTAWTAVKANMGMEIYMTPNAELRKSAKQQVDETLNTLFSKGLTIKNLWIKVTDVEKWTPSIKYNEAFLYELVAAVEERGKKAGIITSFEAYQQITSGLFSFVDDDRIWYGDFSEPVTCSGVEGADFQDFKPFADWKKPAAKQYCVGAKVCDVTVNGNIVSTDSIWTPSS